MDLSTPAAKRPPPLINEQAIYAMHLALAHSRRAVVLSGIGVALTVPSFYALLIGQYDLTISISMLQFVIGVLARRQGKIAREFGEKVNW